MTAAVLLPSALVAGAGLAAAAVIDWRERRIPNWTVALVAAGGLVALAALTPLQALAHAALALALFAAGAWAFSRRWLGGGDVKLLSALGLWVGPALATPFLVLLALATFALALVILLGAAAMRLGSWKRRGLPLGVALAVAGLAALGQRVAPAGGL